MTDNPLTQEDEERYMQTTADFDELMRQEAIEFSKRKAVDHFTACRDCGQFTDKSRWVNRKSSIALKGYRPLCAKCFDEYEFL